ncbi:hypothetical protein [Gloeobacter morelensis]|uniref:Tetratricopeptide repeat protein n=1 Tax=Gloeobacter morelensis MG652769 TaxID=2781736 RepID=A0ABY3PHV6_9CYAN|nr:hypothetical protein [Gloeobacter morelensis]UFP93199.1 hypothetical protein ISF26_15465 [Gloeobacter morelensis MG652769]
MSGRFVTGEGAWALLAACTLGVGALALQWPRLEAKPGTALSLPTPLPPAALLDSACLGYRNLFADWLWLQYVQYFGDRPARLVDGYGRSADYLEAITTLNPRFLFAYAQANYAVAESMGEPARALEILVRGAVTNPGRPDALGNTGTWYLWRLAGSVTFRHFGDYARAAKYFARAAAEPGAPPVMKENAAAFFGAADDRERAIRLWNEFYLEAPTAALREEARRRLRELGVPAP